MTQPARSPRKPAPLIAPDFAQNEPLHRQVYDAVRSAIVSGRLTAGARVPSTRALAAETGVSRVTVSAAFEQLRAEGYIESRVGSGTYVCAGLPEHALHLGRTRSRPKPAAKPPAIVRAPRPPKALVQAHELPAQPTAAIAFIPGIPALDLFPAKLWSTLSARRWKNAVGVDGARLLNYATPLGFYPLRTAVAQYVALSRGVRCEPEQVIITAGAQQALGLIANVLLEPGDAAWLEDPAYFGARSAFEAADVKVVPVCVDAHGMDVAAGEALNPMARLAYVSPSHQFPLGVTMSMPRRLALLDWAARVGAWIVEDDYDGEFRYVGRPMASLQGLDIDRSGGDSRVLYVGTFSKTLFPALRLGYVIVPPSLVDSFAAAKAATAGHTPTMDQAILADFIEEGHFVRHVRRMRAEYADRQAAMVSAASSHLARWVDVQPSPAGMHLVGWLRDEVIRAGVTDQQLADVALEHAVVTTPLSSYRLHTHAARSRSAARSGGALLFGYAGYSRSTIFAAARRLDKAFTDAVGKQPFRRRSARA